MEVDWESEAGGVVAATDDWGEAKWEDDWESQPDGGMSWGSANSNVTTTTTAKTNKPATPHASQEPKEDEATQQATRLAALRAATDIDLTYADVNRRTSAGNMCKIVTPESLRRQMMHAVATVAEILYITKDEALAFLRFFKWKQAKLERAWFENPTKVRRDAGVSALAAMTAPDALAVVKGARLATAANIDGSTAAAAEASNVRVQCHSAFCDQVPAGNAATLPCGHVFCNDCWAAFFQSEMAQGRRTIKSTCPGMKCTLDHPHKFGCACDEAVTLDFFRRFVSDAKQREQYDGWLLDEYVEQDGLIRWCPNPKCTLACMYSGGGVVAIECLCGCRFCFACNRDAHVPAPCDLVDKWLKKETDDDATEIWLQARTKQCPSCNVRIEKNRACNHMTCRKCGHHFCWLCKGKWSDHGSATGGYYECKRYNDDVQAGKTGNEEKTLVQKQTILQKYTFHYENYKSCQQNVVLTRRLHRYLERAMANRPLHSYSFLSDACNKLIDAWHILQWTYVVSYYMAAGRKKDLFVYQQGLLRGDTLALQERLELYQDRPERMLADRRAIVNKTSAVVKQAVEMKLQLDRGELEHTLMFEADATTDQWGCAVCHKSNPRARLVCGCGACKVHGEQQCQVATCKVMRPSGE